MKIHLKMKLHTESVEADAPLFHPNLWGRLIPDEVLQNKSTTELHDSLLNTAKPNFSFVFSMNYIKEFSRAHVLKCLYGRGSRLKVSSGMHKA